MFQVPPRLKPQDKIAIVSPSSGMAFLFPWVYEQGLDQLKKVFHLEPIEFPSARKSPEFLSQNPEARAEDINKAFADPTIKAIIATIGGDDQIRVLPYLNKEVISKNPKIFMGYSDATNLHLFLWDLGIISYYGGALMTQFAMSGGMHDFTVQSIRKALFEPSIGEVKPAPAYTDVDLEWADKQNLTKKRPMYPSKGWVWHRKSDKVIEGRLWGGCLEILDAHLNRRQYLPELKSLEQSVLFLETSEEMPSDAFVYRFIAKLGELKILNKLQAILMGYPKTQFCGKLAPGGREAFAHAQQEAVKKALQDYEILIPVIFNMNFGHTDPQTIVPSGGNVKIDCKTQSLFFD